MDMCASACDEADGKRRKAARVEEGEKEEEARDREGGDEVYARAHIGTRLRYMYRFCIYSIIDFR